jgi:hypothetical protein
MSSSASGPIVFGSTAVSLLSIASSAVTIRSLGWYQSGRSRDRHLLLIFLSMSLLYVSPLSSKNCKRFAARAFSRAASSALAFSIASRSARFRCSISSFSFFFQYAAAYREKEKISGHHIAVQVIMLLTSLAAFLARAWTSLGVEYGRCTHRFCCRTAIPQSLRAFSTFVANEVSMCLQTCKKQRQID